MTILNHRFPPLLGRLYDESFANQLARTQGAISALNQLHHLLLNPRLLMRPILGKEAEKSAQLEGTRASLEDAYKIDIGSQSEEKKNEALEIRNYENAMLDAIEMVKKIGFKEIVIRHTQKTLTRGTRGTTKHPGEYRKGDVWIGDLGTIKEKARYVAPDASHVPQLMEQLVEFANNSGSLNPLIVAAILHHRFEAIHPFEDGNGRTGRLLISLFLIHNKMLSYPILYPSGYFEENRKQYINNLSHVDSTEDWKPWITFFLNGLEIQANLAIDIGLKMNELFKEARSSIEDERASLHLVRVLEHTFVRPIFTASIISDELKIPKATCARYLKTLEVKGVIQLVEEIKKAYVYANIKLLKILRKI